MTHPRVEAIAEHLEGTLDQAEDRQVRAHLRGCADCTDHAQALLALPGLLRTAGDVPALPEHLARRVGEAIAEEARRRAGAAGAAAAAARAGTVRTETRLAEEGLAEEGLAETGRADTAAAAGSDTGTPVTDLGVRRRRRRALAGGMLAAAAATVVAAGLGKVLSDQAAESTGTGGPPGAESLLRSDERARQPGTDRRLPAEQAPSGAALPSDPAGLIADVAAGHDPRRPGHERRDCVADALGSHAARSGASYAVSLPGGAGANEPTPGVVWLRPNDAPTGAVLVSCSPPPRVLHRRGLGE